MAAIVATLVVAWANLVKSQIAKADARQKKIAQESSINLVNAFLDAVSKYNLNPESPSGLIKLDEILRKEYDWRGNVTDQINRIMALLKSTYPEAYTEVQKTGQPKIEIKTIMDYIVEFINWLKQPI